MAFINGSPIDASLMKLDYSPLVEASKFQGQALAQFGKNFVKGIEDYKKKKQKKIEDAEFAEAIKPFVTNIAGGDEEEADKMTRMLVKRPDLFKQFNEVKESSDAVNRAAITQDILNQFSQGNISAQEAFSMGADPDSISAVQGITEGQDAKKFNESVTLAAESVNGTYDPSQNGIVVDTNGYVPGGKEVIPLSDPMFANYFATAKGRTMTGRGFDVLGTMSDAEANASAAEPEVQVPVESIASIPLAAPVEYGQNPSMTEAGEIVHGAMAEGFGSVVDFFKKRTPKTGQFYTPGMGMR